MTYAIVAIGNTQYKVETGKPVTVDLQKAAIGDTITFDKVLLFQDDDKTVIGSPYIDGYTITATVNGTKKAKKIHVLRFRAKSHYHKSHGHRQKYSVLSVDKINSKVAAKS